MNSIIVLAADEVHVDDVYEVVARRQNAHWLMETHRELSAKRETTRIMISHSKLSVEAHGRKVSFPIDFFPFSKSERTSERATDTQQNNKK